MGNPAIGWIAAIIIGGIAGWLAEQFMKQLTAKFDPNQFKDEY